VVRSTFAAVEGASWLCREHVRAIAASMNGLSPLADLALRERSYIVTNDGDLVEQVRFVTLSATIRLTIKQAMLIEPDLSVDFSHVGWARFKSAITIRNRVTHPKTIADLLISSTDMQTINQAFTWMLATTEYVMGATAHAYRAWVADMRGLLEALKSGDADALEAYHAALSTVRSEN